jgi:hypothetical protein
VYHQESNRIGWSQGAFQCSITARLAECARHLRGLGRWLRTQFGYSRFRLRHKIGHRWPAPSLWWRSARVLRPTLLDLGYPFLPHARRDPSGARLSSAGEPLDLAGRLLGAGLLKPPLPPGAHGRERPSLALIGQGARAAPAVKLTARPAGHRPLAAEAATVAHTGAATLSVFAVRAGLCHCVIPLRCAGANLLRTDARVNPVRTPPPYITVPYDEAVGPTRKGRGKWEDSLDSWIV